MELSDKSLHYIIIAILVIVIILLGVHINQMKKEGYDYTSLVSAGANPLTSMDLVADNTAQINTLQGIDQRNAYNTTVNSDYYGKSTGDFVGGDYIVGDNKTTTN